MGSAKEKIVKATALLMGLQVFTQLTGLAKQLVIAAQFGTSHIMDGYLIADSVSALILIWFRMPIRQTLLPIFRYDLSKRGERVAWGNFSVLFNDVALIIVGVTVAGWLSAPYIVALLAPGFDEGTKDLAASLTRIVMVSVIFIGLEGVLSQIFLAYERFFVPGISETVYNLIVMIGFLLFGSAYGIHGLAAVIVFAALCRLALYSSIVWKHRKLYSRKIDLRHPGLREMGHLSIPLLISTGGAELSKITDRIFASLLTAGSLSALAFGHRPMTMLVEFLLQPMQKSTFPHFTKLSAEENFKALSHQLFYYLRIIFFVTLPIAVGLMFISEPVIRLIYQRGAFDETSTRLTSEALFCYAIGFPALLMIRILNRTLFGLKDTWTPTKFALVRIGVKIGLAWLLAQSLAHRGIALAESLSYIVGACLLLAFLPQQLKQKQGWIAAKSCGLTVGASLLMLAVLYAARALLQGAFGLSTELAVLIAIGVVSYAGIATLLGAEEIRVLWQALMTLARRFLPARFSIDEMSR